ncbi:N-terminal acetyltransferase [Didymella pomorum]|uniref:N-terminal acetyltransferase n=1 Tax=Didymella pomorum TaxID=749634 RepID=A0A9W9DBH5_9PLEO|nr:N-terminal acetyltransferase [Didymella pomorum]
MSLFGGDSSAPPTESEYESDTDNPLSPTAEAPLHSPPSAQTRAGLQPVAEEVTQGAADNDADSEESDDEEPERPNRFRGPPQTWKGYTADDRQLAESLQQLEDTDLAAHLYNAHALKRRVRKPTSQFSTLKNWQNKDAWLKQGKELQYTDAVGQVQTELVLAKDWTAWPVPPASLYTLANGFRRAAVAPEKDEWVIGGSGAQDPGQELKDEILGIFLRLAKDSWNTKQWQEDGHQSTAQRVPSRSRSQSVHTDVEMKGASGNELEDGADKTAKERGKKRGRKPRMEKDSRPVITADDAEAERTLRPTIASMLTKLDDVALALHRTRLNHFGRSGFGEGSSQSDFTTDAETTEPESQSRPRSRAKSASRSKPITRQPSRPSSSRASRAPKSPKKPSNVGVQPEDSDSASDYGAQFGEDEAFDSEASRSNNQRRKRSRSASTAEGEDSTNTRDWSRAGLMDWSEVLGIAAVKGWDQKALARTAKRCSALFGENMSFRPFAEDLAAKPLANPVQYTPSTIPPPSGWPFSAPRSEKRPYYQAGAIRCPHPDCYGHHKDFRMAYRVIEHCMRQHGYDPRTNDSDNEERTHGGIHIDGFLQPITAKQGWLGHGRSKAGGKKRKTEEDESSDRAAPLEIEELDA